MAYQHQQIEYLLDDGADLNASTGVVGSLIPGYQPVTVRAAAIVVTEAFADEDGEVNVRFRPTAGNDSDEENLVEFVIPTSASVGDVFYSDGFRQMVTPGQDVVFEVMVADASAGQGALILFVEPCWEHPENNDSMTRVEPA